MTNLDAIIDMYATLKNEIASLEADKKKLEADLASLPAGAYESAKYRLAISDSVRQGSDAELKAQEKAIAEAAVEAYRAGLSRQYLTAHTVETVVRSHRVGLRTGKKLAA